MKYIPSLLDEIKQKIVWAFQRYTIWENPMISNLGDMILILQRKWRSYQVNIRMNNTRLWMKKSQVLLGKY